MLAAHAPALPHDRHCVFEQMLSQQRTRLLNGAGDVPQTLLLTACPIKCRAEFLCSPAGICLSLQKSNGFGYSIGAEQTIGSFQRL
ncbi:MAG TPA: hypothetical protein VFM10_03485, partial [Terriglobales bacterium]|nr:hypothetical protein [Terriglobales bacterium]